jgi:hypothetical protein
VSPALFFDFDLHVVFLSVSASACVALASTTARVFQVRKNGSLEVIEGKQVESEKPFQLRFNLFQVRVGSG